MSNKVFEAAWSRRPDSEGTPKTEAVLEWITAEVKQEYGSGDVPRLEDLRDKLKLTDLESELFLLSVETYGEPKYKNWSLVFLWALAQRYYLGLRYTVRIKDGEIFYDLKGH